MCPVLLNMLNKALQGHATYTNRGGDWVSESVENVLYIEGFDANNVPICIQLMINREREVDDTVVLGRRHRKEGAFLRSADSNRRQSAEVHDQMFPTELI